MKIHGLLRNVWDGMVDVASAIKWDRLQAFWNGGMYYKLKEADHDRIRELLKANYFIVLTRRRSHLTTYIISLMSLLVTKRLSHYTHALMNVEGDLSGHIGFKLVEATSRGVHFSTFMEVFDCDSVALLHPKGLTPQEWTGVLDAVKSQIGRDYDTLFDITTSENVSCVEMVYWGLKSLPNYEQRFPKLVALITSRGNNLTPQMLYDTGELVVAFEIRR